MQPCGSPDKDGAKTTSKAVRAGARRAESRRQRLNETRPRGVRGPLSLVMGFYINPLIVFYVCI